MGHLGQPSDMLGSGSTRKPGCGARHARPEQLIAAYRGEEPERRASGAKSGMSAAIWGGSEEKISERSRPALERFHVVTVRLQSSRAERWQDGRFIEERDTRPGSSSVTLAGVAPRGVIYGPWRSLQVYVPDGLLIETAEQANMATPDADRLDPASIYDPQLHALAGSVVQEIAQQRPGSRLQLDSLAAMVCVHLLRRAGCVRNGDLGIRGGLARRQLKRAMECIAARLEENMSLADLADEVGLSQFHFARAFKQSVGLTPHRYLLHCRLERAKELLAKTDASVSEIAARVGYNEATQLSRLFQAELGTSPSAYRRMSATR